MTYADLKLTNLFGGQVVAITALVDTGATFLFVPESVAVQLGFDVSERLPPWLQRVLPTALPVRR